MSNTFRLVSLLYMVSICIVRSDVSIRVSPEHITTPNGRQNVTVMWTLLNDSVVNGDSNGTIRVYCPSTDNDTNYLASINVSINNINPFNNCGEMNYTLWNMRESYQMRYFNNKNMLLAKSNIINVDSDQPLQGHISLTSNSPYEMRLIWNSIKYPANQSGIVKFGTSSSKYSQIIYCDNPYTYNTIDMCQYKAAIHDSKHFRDPGYMYNVLLPDLIPNTTYYYTFGYDGYMSNEYQFKTSTDSTIKNDSFQFIMYGDQGMQPASYDIINRVYDEYLSPTSFNLLLHVGDLSYAKGMGYIWEEWMNLISLIARHVPYMIEIGNHEYTHHLNSTSLSGLDPSGVAGNGYHPSWGDYNDDSRGECGLPSQKRFIMPNSTDSNSVFWYSFDYKYVHFTVMSSEHNLTRGSIAYNWILNDFKSVNRTETPWLIFNIHRPLYCSDNDTYECEPMGMSYHLRLMLEDLLYEYNVDLVLTGHLHSYQRTCPVYKSKCIGFKNGGIVHLMIGTGGRELLSGNYLNQTWIEYTTYDHYGYGKFKVNATSLQFQFKESVQSRVLDSMFLSK